MLAVLRRPKWIVFTLIVPLAMWLCFIASQWQYGRHLARRAVSAQVEAAEAGQPVALAQVVAPGMPLPIDDKYQSVTVNGEFVGAPVLVRRKVLDGAPGFWVVGSLQTDSGPIVQVLRGWVRMSGDARATPTVPAPPAGKVTVTGWLAPTETMPIPNPTDLPAGQIAALDTAGLAAGSPTYSPYVVASSMQPTDSAELKLVPRANPGLGPHLAYSWQWIAFAIMIPTGWFILLRRDVRAARALPEATGDAEDAHARDGA